MLRKQCKNVSRLRWSYTKQYIICCLKRAKDLHFLFFSAQNKKNTPHWLAGETIFVPIHTVSHSICFAGLLPCYVSNVIIFAGHPKYAFWNMFISWFAIDILQCAQIGLRLFNIVGPPFDSAMICPQWKLKVVIAFDLQQKHFPRAVSTPINFSQTIIRKLIGIFLFL